ncbi:MAG: hypothetical protein AB1403_02760 [Candidatus Riflebacteria bacterium]
MKLFLRNRRGIAIPLTIVAAIVVMGFIFSMTTLNQGLKTQVFQTNNHQLSFIMAYSAYSRLVAKIHTFSWANRPFLNEPYVEEKVALQGGHYDMLAENTAGRDYQADVYIRTELAGVKRLYFWRISFNDDLLDISNRIIVETFLNGDSEDFPKKTGPRPLAGKVNNMIAERKNNQKASDDLAFEIAKINEKAKILEKLSGKPPEEFNQNYPSDPQGNLPAGKPMVNFPAIPPLTQAELPTNLRKNPVKDAAGFPQTQTGTSDMSTERLDQLSKNILDASREMNELNKEGWDEFGQGDQTQAHEVWKESDEKKMEAYNSIDNLVNTSDDLLKDAPSDEARKAIEEMVSQTVAAGLTDLVSGIQRSTDVYNEHGNNVLNNVQTSDEAARMVEEWYGHVQNLKAEQERVNSTIDSISDYSKSAEIQGKISDAKETAKEGLEVAEHYLELMRQKLQELREKEAEERRRQEEENAGN